MRELFFGVVPFWECAREIVEEEFTRCHRAKVFVRVGSKPAPF